MKIAIIAVPYDSGRRGFRMGAGPEHLLKSGLAQQLEQAGHVITTSFVETDAPTELTAAFDIAAQVASLVAGCVARAEWPLVLSGGCMVANGVFAGLQARPAVLWLDAHADLNTPETSPSGFLDGMALAVLTGRCHREYSRAVPGFERLRDQNLLLLGVRSIDAGETEPLSQVRTVRSSRELWSALAKLKTPDLYLHIDVDALDPSVLRANDFAAPRGLSMYTVQDAIAAVKANTRIAALTISAYDPAADRENQGPRVVAEILEHVLT